jgi:membrane associated rhomboid family serine protease
MVKSILAIKNSIQSFFQNEKASQPFSISIDNVLLLAMIAFCNLHLIFPAKVTPLIFTSQDVMAGKWWLLITHPFVHASWYHLALDAGSFILLYNSLQTSKISWRLFYVTVCGLFCLGLTLILGGEIHYLGLSGISGIAHGLMAVSALELIFARTNAGLGWVCLAIVVFKAMYEIVTDTVLFSFLLLGMCGTPLAACHAGGVLGGIIAFYIRQSIKPRCMPARPEIRLLSPVPAVPNINPS